MRTKKNKIPRTSCKDMTVNLNPTLDRDAVLTVEMREFLKQEMDETKAMGDQRSRRRLASRNELSKARGCITELEKELCDLRVTHASLEAKLKQFLAIDWIQLLENWGSISEEYRTKFYKVLDGLSPREQKVIKMFYGVDFDRRYRLEEIAKEFSVTRDRIRQIKERVRRRISHPSRRMFFGAAKTVILREKLGFMMGKDD